MLLQRLTIENFAIIDHLAVELADGFTIMTGETGAGKSIIIDALGLALGEKADLSMIRSGADKAVIVCEFSGLDRDQNILAELGKNQISVSDNTLFLRRELNAAGRSRAWINGTPCPVNVLKTIGDLVVDLHGQHDHQSLLREESHIDFLDAYGDYSELRQRVERQYEQLCRLTEQISLLRQRHQLNRERKELWEFQKAEIQKTNLQAGEYEQLADEKSLLENAEKIHQIANQLNLSLYEGEDSFYQQMQSVIRRVNTLADMDKSFQEYLPRLKETQYLFQELSKSLARYDQEIQFDPKKLEAINQRLFTLQQLMKKYNNSIAGILEYQQEIEGKLNADEGLEQEIERLEGERTGIIRRFSQIAWELSQARRSSATELEEEIHAVLERLGIRGSRFQVEIENVPDSRGWVQLEEQAFRADRSGMDRIRFLISTNPGEPLRPLIHIVSGGEVSRIMLALKTITAGRDAIPVLIFDEIDTGISGKIAHVVGRELHQLAHFHQVICITHLPQIASLGDQHISVAKVSSDDRTRTLVETLAYEDRVHEIAKLIGGETVTPTSLQQARELLAEIR